MQHPTLPSKKLVQVLGRLRIALFLRLP